MRFYIDLNFQKIVSIEGWWLWYVVQHYKKQIDNTSSTMRSWTEPPSALALAPTLQQQNWIFPIYILRLHQNDILDQFTLRRKMNSILSMDIFPMKYIKHAKLQLY